MNQGADLLPEHKLSEIALGIHVEHDYRHVALTAKGKRSLVHDFKAVPDGLVERKLVIFHGIRILLRVRIIDPVNARSFQKGVRTYLKSPERRT